MSLGNLPRFCSRTLAVGLCALLLAPALFAAPPRVLLVYDGKPEVSGEGYLSARFIANLLGHFEARYEIERLADYRAGRAANFDAVFFASVGPQKSLPAPLLEDAAAGQTTFVWLGRNIGHLLTPGVAQRLGFSYIDYTDDDEFHRVEYRGIELPKGDPELNQVGVLDSSRATVHATARNRTGELYPYVIQSGRFWYFADSPFSFVSEGDRYLVFADLLHDILGVPHAAARRALVRIEDVSPDQDPASLRAIADYLHSQRVPFQVALIPIYRDPERGVEIYLSDRPEFAEAVRYMAARGGTVVMHGVTHQYRAASGDDFEFWNDLEDGPLPSDGRRDVLDRKLELGLRECFRNGIYPLSWETPHNAASERTYRLLSDYFTVFHERVMAAPALATTQYFPYPVRDLYGRFVVPENLGFVPLGSTDTRPVLDAARSMLAVRDGIASFYFHPFMPLDLLKQMVRGVRDRGYRFISLREFSPRVEFREWQVAVAGPDGRVPPAPRALTSGYARVVIVDPGGAVREERVAVPESGDPISAEPGALVAWSRAAGPAPPPPSAWQRVRLFLARHWRSPATATLPLNGSPDIHLVWDASAEGAAERGQNSLEGILKTYGYPVERLAWDPAQPLRFVNAGADGGVVVIPAAVAAALSSEQQDAVLARLRSGGNLLLAGRSPLAEQLGVRFAGRTVSVYQATDLNHPERYLQWSPPEQVERFDPPEDAVTLMTDPSSRQALAFSGQFHEGRYILLAAPLDSITGLGIARYPYLAQYLQETFGARPRLLRPAIEVYFDPSQRPGIDLSRLVNSWRKSGIRVVHVKAWEFLPGWEFPYRKFIDLCHRRGLAVYAWFEPPMVTEAFWHRHPEWREKTASGADGLVGWRYLMNLRNPRARQAALAVFRQIMEFDWDGVNLAELNFDAGNPVMDPDKYVPMNDDVRREFQAEAGFDPIDLFRPRSRYFWKTNPAALQRFSDYRVRLVTELHRVFLDEARQLAAGRGLEIVVTMLDSLHSKTLRADIGVDSREIVKLMDEYDFTLQVQDPSEFWADTPERYRTFGETYLKLLKDPARLMFDVNIVERDVKGKPLPASVATGAEFARLLAAASAPTGRAIVYSEWTVLPQDWELAASALASGARVAREGDGWRIESPFAVAVRVPLDQHSFHLDGRPWPVVDAGSVLAPRGSHLLAVARPRLALADFFSLEQLDIRLRAFSGELLGAEVTPRGMTFNYSAPGRAVAVFNKQPYRVLVDGREWAVAPLYSQGEWAIVLPSGRHAAEVVANEPAVFAVELLSLLASSLIVLFGAVSCGSMLALYLVIRVRRAAAGFRRRPPAAVPGIPG